MNLIRFPRLQSKCGGLGKTKMYELIKLGLIPKPVKIGRASLWVEADVDAALAQMAKKSA